MVRRAQTVFVLASLVLLAACNGFFVPPNALVSISVSPGNSTIQPGKTQQFSAVATFGDQSTQDVTSSVTWSSSSTSIATINSSGLATAVALGNATISAVGSDNKTTGTTTLTVSNNILQSIAVTPANPNLTAGQTQQMTATGTFSNNATQDITTTVTWASSNSAIATVSATGVVSALSSGTTTITATSGTVSGNTNVTVF